MSSQIAVVVGTRPEIIKLAPVIHRLGERALVVHTGQHFDDNMSQTFLEQLHLGHPDLHLTIGGKTRGAQIGQATIAIEKFLLDQRPAAVVVQGDTNSGVAGALAANSTATPLVHVEAGMRSYDRAMPEEHNRVLIDVLADLCLAPHASNADALRREGIADTRISVTGSTLRDALTIIMPTASERADYVAARRVEPNQFVLATIHRAENTDHPERLAAIVDALEAMAQDLPVVWPLHPRTRAVLQQAGRLDGLTRRATLINPVGYLDMVQLEKYAALIATDSGGVQKEAYFHRVPCVTLRDETEWGETLAAGWNRLWTQADYVTPRRDIAEYGEGEAASKMVGLIGRFLGG